MSEALTPEGNPEFVVFKSGPNPESYIFDPRRGANYDDYAIANGLLRKPTFFELKEAFMCGDPRIDGPSPESYVFNPRRGNNYNTLAPRTGNTARQLESAYIDTAAACSSLACAHLRRESLPLQVSMLITEAEAILQEASTPETEE